MARNAIIETAEKFGLTVETTVVADQEKAIRIYKGANQIFSGNEEMARSFLANYHKDLPGLYEGSMYGYRE